MLSCYTHPLPETAWKHLTSNNVNTRKTPNHYKNLKAAGTWKQFDPFAALQPLVSSSTENQFSFHPA